MSWNISEPYEIIQVNDYTESNIWLLPSFPMGFPGDSVVKNSPASAGDARDNSSTLGSGRSPGGRNGNPCQYSCLGNSTDRGAWRATVHGVTKSWTWLSMHATILVSWCSPPCAILYPSVSTGLSDPPLETGYYKSNGKWLQRLGYKHWIPYSPYLAPSVAKSERRQLPHGELPYGEGHVLRDQGGPLRRPIANKELRTSTQHTARTESFQQPCV